jgi:septum site-determining protein MinC
MIEIKGWRNGLLVFLASESTETETPWDTLMVALESRLNEANTKAFWKNAQTTIDLGARAVDTRHLDVLVDRLKSEYGIIPVAVVTTSAETKAAAEKLFLTVYETLPSIRKPTAQEVSGEILGTSAESAVSPMPEAADQNNARYVPQTVRSGQRILHNGHLIVCGDVNAGAEVFAAGDIVVFGTLRGVAHAGCYGDETARIVAGTLRPPQIRIAEKIARSPEGTGPTVGLPRRPEVARIRDGEIEVSPL